MSRCENEVKLIIVKTFNNTSPRKYYFFNGEWIQKLVLMVPVLNSDGKIILADSGRCLGYRMEYFRNYNKIIKTSLNNG